MKPSFTILRLLALALGTGYASWGQTYSQVPLTAGSFTADVIANGSAAVSPALSTTADVDGTGYYFMSQDYYTATTAHTSGIPNSGLIPNSIAGYSALTYQLASLSANNSLRIAGGATGTGTITFATPTAASEVYVLASSGSGISTVDMTVNYANGTTTTFPAQSVPDWFTASATLNVFGMTGRSSLTTPVSTPYAATNTAPFFDQVKLTIPGAQTATTITGITFAKTSTSGFLQVVAVSIATYPACTTPPTAGTAVASSTSLCAGGTATLTLSGVNAATGLTYQWQSSTTSATTGFTNITGATNNTYTTPVLTQTTYYRAVVTCSGQSATSAVATVAVLAPTYATVPYTQGFENTWTSRCGTDDAPDASWLNTPATGNASWRRDDDGATAGWTAATSGAYTPAGSDANGASSSHSARFHNYYVSSGTVGTLDLYVNLSGGTGTPTLKFDYRNRDTNAVTVLLSTDGGVTFSATPLQTLGTQTAWTSYTVALPATVTATTVIRFRAVGNFASYDTGLDNVSITTAASCIPSTATFSYGTASSYCVSGTTSPTVVLATGATAGTFSSTTGLTVNATTGAITLSSSTPGAYTITNTVAAMGASCASTATTSVTITAAPTAGFSYPAATACAGTATTKTPTLATGATMGTFTLPTATGLSVNATTGVVTIGATATAGTYAVTNTVAASGGCAAVTSTASFIITAPTTATFSYAGSPFCTTGTTATPTITGTAGGTFSSTTGLTINATTGTIALGSSTPGTYVVTYTVAGTCGSSSTQSVTITAPQTAGFSYATPALGTACAGSTSTFAALLATGASAGTFTISPTGPTINASTGAISLAGAAAGTYTVTNTVAASGGCAASTSTATFTVSPLPATPTLATSGTPATGITLTSSATTGNQFYLNGQPITGATGQTYLVNSGKNNGTYTVVATSAAGCTSAASAAVTVTVTATAPTAAGTSLTLYPNPTRDGHLTLELRGYQETVSLAVVNALGQRVYAGAVGGTALTRQQALDLSALPAGVYLLQVRTASGSPETRRFVRE